MDIKQIQQELARFAAERDWDQFHTPKNLSMALAKEAAELLEIFQWLTEEQSMAVARDNENTARAADEIADIAIYLLRIADRLEIDIEAAIARKMALNAEKYPVDLAKGNAEKYSRRVPRP
jgi:NTP pyrophosphatase (non-canonical NTP hydrolase)